MSFSIAPASSPRRIYVLAVVMAIPLAAAYSRMVNQPGGTWSVVALADAEDSTAQSSSMAADTDAVIAAAVILERVDFILRRAEKQLVDGGKPPMTLAAVIEDKRAGPWN